MPSWPPKHPTTPRRLGLRQEKPRFSEAGFFMGVGEGGFGAGVEVVEALGGDGGVEEGDGAGEDLGDGFEGGVGFA